MGSGRDAICTALSGLYDQGSGECGNDPLRCLKGGRRADATFHDVNQSLERPTVVRSQCHECSSTTRGDFRPTTQQLTANRLLRFDQDHGRYF
jgi:hypothetical protein